MKLLILLVLLYATLSTLAKPIFDKAPVTVQTPINNGITIDGPSVLTKTQLDTLPMYCPHGIQKGHKPKNILFIHGTGTNGNLTFDGLFPSSFHKKGYSSCWINLPFLSLSDAQLTSEYVMHYIGKLYEASGNKPIYLLGHSQGNMNIQWALNFFPSIRIKVKSFVSLSGDFQGTEEGPIISAVQNRTLKVTMPSLLQQSVLFGKPSNFLQALNKHGNMALVPTTSIYGNDDEVIQRVQRATMLGSGGAPFTHIAVQKLCSHLIVDHALILVNRVAFYLALDAFENNSNADLQRTVANSPDLCKASFAPNMARNALYRVTKQTSKSLFAIFSAGHGTTAQQYRTTKEPALVPYALNQP